MDDPSRMLRTARSASIMTSGPREKTRRGKKCTGRVDNATTCAEPAKSSFSGFNS